MWIRFSKSFIGIYWVPLAESGSESNRKFCRKRFILFPSVEDAEKVKFHADIHYNFRGKK